MKSKNKILCLTDMDVGLFVSYEMTAEALTTKLFRIFTLNTIPLKKLLDFREADTKDFTRLNKVNWFDLPSSRPRLCPVYTLQAKESSPRIFMRLSSGSHVAMKNEMDKIHV